MDTNISTYEQQAIDFLASTNTTIKVDFIKNDKYFDNDKETRDIYNITLSNSRVYSFLFGNSIASSGEYKILDNLLIKKFGKTTISAIEHSKLNPHDKRECILNKEFKTPSAYDVLSCLTKYDPGTLEDFCSEYGYDADSKKAEKIYLSVREEFINVRQIFTEKQLELLREIN